jgi:hypothetical protein
MIWKDKVASINNAAPPFNTFFWNDESEMRGFHMQKQRLQAGMTYDNP